jgi:chromosome segregation ATPase
MPDEKDMLIADLRKQNEQLIDLVSDLQKTVSELQDTIKELQEQLNKNSGNSSKPPSSDGFKKPANKNRSLRKKSGKKPGGQKGHEGSYLAVLSEPDHTENHLHSDCTGCPHYEKCRIPLRQKGRAGV